MYGDKLQKSLITTPHSNHSRHFHTKNYN